jgi:hypothetical protein
MSLSDPVKSWPSRPLSAKTSPARVGVAPRPAVVLQHGDSAGAAHCIPYCIEVVEPRCVQLITELVCHHDAVEHSFEPGP